jgi:O-antigen/teichoic acid export membrane protein
MERTKSSFLNIVMSLASTFINTLMALIVVNLTIRYFGSDLNGVTATINQIMILISIVEGGFTLATNVSLYKPYVEGDTERISSILSAARIVFNAIGAVFALIGTGIAVLYPFVIKSDADRTIIMAIFFMAVIPVAFNFVFAIKYRIMFQVAQKEYMLTSIGVVTGFLSQLTGIIILLLGGNILLFRFSTMVFALLNSLSIYFFFRSRFKNISFKAKPSFISARSTMDVVMQRVTGVIYSSMPVLFIATFIGTIYASVYAVYNSIFSIVKNVAYSFVNAPVNGFGQLVAEKGRAGSRELFYTFELMTVMVLNSLITTTLVFILPFIRLYTSKISDINYVDWKLAILFLVIVSLEVIHIPSGIIINVTGHFRLSRNIQIASALVLCISGGIFGHVFGFYGILTGNILCNILLASLEIFYTHERILGCSTGWYLKVLACNGALAALIIIAGMRTAFVFTNYISFFATAFIGFVAITAAVLLLNFVAFRRQLLEIVGRLKVLLYS